MQHYTDPLIDAAYAAALDDDLWRDWSLEAATSLGGVGCVFCVLNGREGTVERFVLSGRSEAVAEDYFTGWHAIDPQTAHVSRFTRPTVYTTADYLDLADPDERAFTEWHRRVGRIDQNLGATVTLGGADYLGGVSVHRAFGDGAPTPAERERLEGLLPELQRAMQLGFRHARMLDADYWSGIEAAQHDEPALLIDEAGRVTRTNPGALAFLSSQDELAVRSRRLTCTDPAAAARLEAAIGRAIAPVDARSGAVRVPRRSGATAVLVVTPLVRARRMLAPFEAAALVRIVLPAPATSPTLYREAFDLAPREGDLAALLMGHHSLESAAALMAISLATARVHVRRIFEKTGTSRQSDLMRLLARF